MLFERIPGHVGQWEGTSRAACGWLGWTAIQRGLSRRIGSELEHGVEDGIPIPLDPGQAPLLSQDCRRNAKQFGSLDLGVWLDGLTDPLPEALGVGPALHHWVSGRRPSVTVPIHAPRLPRPFW